MDEATRMIQEIIRPLNEKINLLGNKLQALTKEKQEDDKLEKLFQSFFSSPQLHFTKS